MEFAIAENARCLAFYSLSTLNLHTCSKSLPPLDNLKMIITPRASIYCIAACLFLDVMAANHVWASIPCFYLIIQPVNLFFQHLAVRVLKQTFYH